MTGRTRPDRVGALAFIDPGAVLDRKNISSLGSRLDYSLCGVSEGPPNEPDGIGQRGVLDNTSAPHALHDEVAGDELIGMFAKQQKQRLHAWRQFTRPFACGNLSVFEIDPEISENQSSRCRIYHREIVANRAPASRPEVTGHNVRPDSILHVVRAGLHVPCDIRVGS